MKKILELRNFKPLEEFLHKRINISLQVENIYIKYEEVIPEYSIERNLNIEDILKESKKEYLKTERSVANNRLMNTYEHRYNTAAYYFTSEKWRSIFYTIGDRYSVFLLTCCQIIQESEGKLIYLAGDFYNSTVSDTKISYYVNRNNMFKTYRELPYFDIEDLMNRIIFNIEEIKINKEIVDENLSSTRAVLEIISAKFFKIPFKLILKLCFIDKQIIDNNNICEINPHDIIKFLMMISLKFLKPILTGKEFKKLNGKIQLLIMKNLYETFSIENLKSHFSLSKCKLFVKKKTTSKENILRTKIFESVLLYLFNNIFIPIISYHFYCTTSSSLKLKIVYFMKDEWLNRSRQYLNEHFRNMNRVRNINPKIPSATVKCIPKNDGFRLITNCSKKEVVIESKYGFSTKRSINSYISPIIPILRESIRNNNQSACIGSNDINKILKEYLSKNKERKYFLKVDLKDCYNKINQKVLKEFINSEKWIEDKKYYNYTEIKTLILNLDTDTFQYQLIKKSLDKPTPISLINLESIENQIFYESKNLMMKGSNIKAKIKELIDNLYVRHNHYKYQMETGIPQGCSISSFLCTIYISEISNHVFKFIKKGKLLIFADDFLMITPDFEEMEKFYKTIKLLEKYGLRFNEDKMETNFDESIFLNQNTTLSILTSFIFFKNNQTPSINKESINWCGLKLFSEGFAVKSVFKRTNLPYLVHIKSNKPGVTFRNNIIKNITSKLNTLILNKENIKVYENLYDLMLNTFIKIKIGFERMPFINYKFVLKIINEIENIFKDLVKRKKICTEKLVVKILNSSFKDSRVQKLCFTSNKRRFK